MLNSNLLRRQFTSVPPLLCPSTHLYGGISGSFLVAVKFAGSLGWDEKEESWIGGLKALWGLVP